MEKRLGIAKPADGASSSKNNDPEVLPGGKRRFDDTEYLEQSKEIVDTVKSAVSAGAAIFIGARDYRMLIYFLALLKKKKKAKTTHTATTDQSNAVREPTTSTSIAPETIKAPPAITTGA
jgi:hypothetical protein